MTFNAKIIHEPGGSVLRVASGGSLVVEAGGTISGGGNLALTSNGGLSGSTLVLTGGATTASLTVSNSLFLGTNVQIMFAASTAAPSGLPVTASPGAIFFRSDGANSAGYVNVSSGTAGSVWKIFSEL